MSLCVCWFFVSEVSAIALCPWFESDALPGRGSRFENLDGLGYSVLRVDWDLLAGGRQVVGFFVLAVAR